MTGVLITAVDTTIVILALPEIGELHTALGVPGRVDSHWPATPDGLFQLTSRTMGGTRTRASAPR